MIDKNIMNDIMNEKLHKIIDSKNYILISGNTVEDSVIHYGSDVTPQKSEAYIFGLSCVISDFVLQVANSDTEKKKCLEELVEVVKDTSQALLDAVDESGVRQVALSD